MSKILITCERYNKKEAGEKKQEGKGVKLVIESNQLFMNTEKFFMSAKESLEKYFDKIEKK